MNNGQKTLESMSQAVWYNQWTSKRFISFLKGDILEIGCGIGNFTKTLINYGNVWAIDINKDYIIKTKMLIGSEVKVGSGDVESGKYFFKDKKFDSVVCLNVLEHIENDNKALENIEKLLKENGYLILLVPIHQKLYGEIDKSIGHYRRYQKGLFLKKLRNLGFKIIYAKKINFIGALGWWWAGKILKNNTVDEQKLKVFNMLAPLILFFENFIEPPIGTSVLVIAEKGSD